MSVLSRHWRGWRRLGLLVVVAAAAGTAGVWWYRTTRPEYRLLRGREAIEQNDWTAVNQLADALEASGETDRALLLRAEALIRQRYFGNALTALNGSRDEGEIRLRAAVLSGRCLLELRQLRQAHAVYTWVLEQDPEQIDALRGLAAIDYDLGQLRQAVDLLERVASLDTQDGRPHRLIGLIQKDLSRYPQADAAYREALRRQLPPGFAQAIRREWAEVLLQQKRYSDALAVVDEMPQRPEAADLAARAEALVGLNRTAEARTVLEKALAQHPEDAKLLRLRGQIHLKDGELKRAVGCLEQAVHLAPRDEVAHHNLALAYSASGRTADAAREQKQVEELRADLKRLTDLSSEAMQKPWDSGVRERLAELCQRMDKPELAAMWSEAAKACQVAH